MTTASHIRPVTLTFPDGVRCVVALSYDLEMCAGYARDAVNHDRIIPAVQRYTLCLCDIAEKYGSQLHFFFVCNGLEEDDIDYLREIKHRGHVIDSHTYSHQDITRLTAAQLDDELSRSDRLLRERLEVTSTVLRGPFGYERGWESLPPENRRIILANGFRWLSGQCNVGVYGKDWDYWVRAPERDFPYVYPEGLIEIPFQGWTDRMWFDLRPSIDQAILDEWRGAYGHRPVPEGWRAPWTPDAALDDWITLNLQTLDYAYEHRLLWVPVWHPYTHYLHDPHNRTLEALLDHAAQKQECVWVCTLRDAAEMLVVGSE